MLLWCWTGALPESKGAVPATCCACDVDPRPYAVPCGAWRVLGQGRWEHLACAGSTHVFEACTEHQKQSHASCRSLSISLTLQLQLQLRL